jgi:hypothetical protein
MVDPVLVSGENRDRLIPVGRASAGGKIADRVETTDDGGTEPTQCHTINAIDGAEEFEPPLSVELTAKKEELAYVTEDVRTPVLADGLRWQEYLDFRFEACRLPGIEFRTPLERGDEPR